MQMTDFLSLLGGLALFLYGMQMMSSGLEAAGCGTRRPPRRPRPAAG